MPQKILWFQVVPPCGGHHVLADDFGMSNRFQVVPPCGGHLLLLKLQGGQLMFQVVPPCGGHRDLSVQRVILPSVSSRAPVWGASLPGTRLYS